MFQPSSGTALKKPEPRNPVRRRSLRASVLALFSALLLCPASFAAVSVTDDAGRQVKLAKPAQRIVSLAPHATEMLFAVGAGKQVVGVVQHSDYPAQATRIASVGSGTALDLERILALQPDLIVAWGSGNSAPQVQRLRALGIPVYESEPRDYDTIAASLERLGVLARTEQAGKAAAGDFRARLAALKTKYANRPTLTVFYQIWSTPLMTLNGEHMVSQALRLCGARNVFEDLSQLAPTVSVESVVKANPDVIIASGGEQQDVLAPWRRFTGMKAVARANLLTIDGSLLNRPGPRIVEGTEALCRSLDRARAKM
ncbi:MAG TPA: cobalamin-binding protein [Noviherbaspirillum sp.]